MAGEALFIGWGAVVRGREKQSLQVFQESMEYWGKLQQDGRIDSFDVLLLAPHGGDLQGFAVLRGDRKTLADVRFSDEWRISLDTTSMGKCAAIGGGSVGLRGSSQAA